MATGIGLRETRSTPHPKGKHEKADRFPSWWMEIGTAGECVGTRTVSSSGETTSTARNRTSVCRRSPYRSPADPVTSGGRSTIPATGCSQSSISRLVGRAQEIPPWVTSRRTCWSTGYASGSRSRLSCRFDDLNQVELPALEKPEPQVARNREGGGTSESCTGRQRCVLFVSGP